MIQPALGKAVELCDRSVLNDVMLLFALAYAEDKALE